MRLQKTILPGVILLIAFSACAPQTTPTQEIAPSVTPGPSPTIDLMATVTAIRSVPTSTRTRIPSPTRAPTATRTPTPTATPTPLFTFQEATPIYLGTPLPADGEPIGAGNISRLVHAAQWGKGAIRAVAFAPDGRSFVVGSAAGLAVYDMNDLSGPPRWLPFEEPNIRYDTISFSTDGSYIMLDGQSTRQIRTFPGNQPAQSAPGAIWLVMSRLSDRGDIQVDSPDGTRRLRGRTEYDENSMYLEQSIREVYDTGNDVVLFTLSDDTFYLQYGDIHRPEGCDLYSFSYCGNVYDPSAYRPYRAGFSPRGDTLAIIYRVPNYGNPNRFSILRLYDARNGGLLTIIGSLDKPVETFAYSPDGATLLVGYVDGSIQLWPALGTAPTFGAEHFNAPIAYLQFSGSGDFLLIQRYGTLEPALLEVRRTSDGALFASHAATAFALSPDDDLLAIADPSGEIRIRRVDTGERLQYIPAHTGMIYSLAFSPNGQYLASSSEDCTIRLWDVASGQFLHYFEEISVNAYEETSTESRIFAYSLDFVPGTDQLIGFGSWGTAVSWNVNSGARNYLIESAPLEYYMGMATLNPHFPGSFSVDLANNRVYIDLQGYDLQTGELQETYELPASLPKGCAPAGPMTPDGQLMFTLGYGDLDGKICVLRAGDLQFVQALTVLPETNYDYGLLWPYLSPDGRQLIVPTTDGVLHVYQVMP